jgi:hypothetical protein
MRQITKSSKLEEAPPSANANALSICNPFDGTAAGVFSIGNVFDGPTASVLSFQKWPWT